MAHVRAQIRAALAGLFASDVPGSFASVETARAHRLDRDALPVLTIGWEQEQAQHGAGGSSGRVVRVTQWTLAVHLSGTESVADAADALALVVEQRIGADPTLSGSVAHARVTGSSFALSGETEQRSAVLALTVETMVVTAASDPETRV